MAERVSADFTFHDVKVKIVGNLDIICVRKSAFASISMPTQPRRTQLLPAPNQMTHLEQRKVYDV